MSIYHCNDDIYEKIRDQTDIYIVDPKVKEIKFNVDAETVFFYVEIVLTFKRTFHIRQSKC